MSFAPERRRSRWGLGNTRSLAWLLGCAALSSCARWVAEPFEPAPEWHRHAYGRGGPKGDALAGAVLRQQVCDGENLRPEYARLDESDLVRFLEQHASTTSVERPRGDLAYVSVHSKTAPAVRLRVAVLASADEAGRELATAIAQQGAGAWGIHRSNLAVLGPVDAPERVIDLVSTTKLACWGVLTMGSGADVVVIPGGYREL